MDRLQMRLRRSARALILLALGGVASIVLAEQTLIADQSEIAYVTTQMGVPVDGKFGRFGGQVNLDPKNLQSSSVSFWVDTSSVIFPAPDVVKELAKPEWFDTAHFPKAEFRSTHIRALGGGRYEISGTLTIKGHSREVVIPVSLSRSGAITFAAGALGIKRLDFGVGQGEWGDTSLVEDEVQIKFKIAISGVGPL
jgi:polyisoprenoid-binding protein YceI